MRRKILLVFLVTAALGNPHPLAPEQPLAFNHELHAGKKAIACTTCHGGAEGRARAGLPAFATCLSCHMQPQGDPPSRAEAEVRRLAALPVPPRWIQVTRNPGHVYFSHRAHVTLAQMSCAACHGDVTQWRAPPREPEERLQRMAACQACHRREEARLGCATCHR